MSRRLPDSLHLEQQVVGAVLRGGLELELNLRWLELELEQEVVRALLRGGSHLAVDELLMLLAN